ncbi:uncharacterized protein METZ01_LOCUS357981, partial [marine metagenome]
MKLSFTYLALLFVLIGGSLNATYFTNGIKIGEVDQDSAIIWTRLSRNAEFNTQGRMFIEYEVGMDGRGRAQNGSRYPDGATLEDMAFSLPGTEGEVRLTYWPNGNMNQVVEEPWKPVNPSKDFT